LEQLIVLPFILANVLGAGMSCIREYFLRKRFSIGKGRATLHVLDVSTIGTTAATLNLMTTPQANSNSLGRVRYDSPNIRAF
jgi:hypothetical protein